MSTTLKQKNVWDYIADLSQRLNRLETGGKPLLSQSDVADFSFSLNASSYATITTSLSWEDPNVTVNPNGRLHFSWYVDVDNDPDNHWPDGANIDPTATLIFWFYDLADNQAADFKETIVHWLVWNLDSSSHTYYVYDLFSYLSGQSGSGSA